MLSQSAHLPFEGTLEPIIVTYRGQNRTVRRERDGWQRIAVEIQAGQEFAGDVLSIGGAAAVSGNQDLVTAAQATAWLSVRLHAVSAHTPSTQPKNKRP